MIEIWLQDEMRMGLHGILSRQWGRRGERLQVYKQTEYEWVYMYGASNPFQGKSTSLLLPEVNTLGMNLFLETLSSQVALGAHAFVFLDRAAWHRAKSLKIPTNIELILLPAYSPDLNPIEQVWGYLKNLFLSNRVYDSYEDLLDKMCDAWNWFQKQPSLVKSLTNIKWLSQLSFL